MRNLKKILALVLALVMSMSLMATANAFTDDASITAEYETAAKVLADMGIFKGYPDGSFQPTAAITRQEVAAIMYRISSKDVTDKQDDLYVEGANFTDVKATDWSAGYIGYCANGGIVGGYGNGKFGPQDKVTGYQVLAMALRAIGYDKNGEFTGADWAKNVATTAQALGILEGIPGTVQLSQPATRELVAQLVFKTMTVAKMVEYTPAFGYQPKKVALGTNTITLGEQQFELTSKTEQDVWGRPVTKWTYNVGEKATKITKKATATYYVATTECTIASDVKLTADEQYTLYTNGIGNSQLVTVQLTDTVNKIGAQGALVQVYGKDYIVVIDTLLAKVTDVKDATYDAAGHLKTPSSITLDVYVDDQGYQTVTLENGKTNYTYAKKDMVLVSAVQTPAGYLNYTDKHVEIQGLAKTMVGAQSTIWYNVEQHTIDGTIYNDNNRFHLDQAGYEITKHTWYFDGQGNLIGATDIDTIYAYGVLSKLYWVNDGSNYGAGAAYGVITYMDGTESGVVQIAKIDGQTTTYARTAGNVGSTYGDDKFGVSTYALDNADLLLTELYKIETQANGTLLLTKESKTNDGNNKIATGVSKVDGETLYADNFTQYLVYNTTTKTFAAFTGYENIATFSNIDFCYKNNTTNTFMQYVFIKGLADEATAADFVYVTNNGAQFNLYTDANGVQYITISGVVRADGSTAPVVVKVDSEAGVTATVAALQAKLTVGKLFLVPTVGGYVTDIDTIAEVTSAGTTYKTTTAVYEGVPTNYTANGVLVVDGVHYNVNSATTIVTEAGKGTTADLTAAVVNGKYVYVVYKTTAPTTAVAIFVSSVAGTGIWDAQAKLDAAKALQASTQKAKVDAYNEYVEAGEKVTAAEATEAEKQADFDAAKAALNTAKAAVETAETALAAAQEAYEEFDDEYVRVCNKNHQHGFGCYREMTDAEKVDALAALKAVVDQKAYAVETAKADEAEKQAAADAAEAALNTAEEAVETAKDDEAAAYETFTAKKAANEAADKAVADAQAALDALKA